MEAVGMICRWESCGELLQPMAGKKFVKCDKCRHMNCLSCRASHEGVNCATYQAQRQPASSPPRSPSAGDSSPKGGSSFSRTSRNYGGGARPEALSSPPRPSRPSFEGVCQSPRPAYAPSTSAATSKATSPGQAPQQLASGGAKRRAHCATEGCGYEVLVDENATELPCYKCRRTTCLRCNATHGTLTCEQYRQKLCDDEDETQEKCANPGCPFIAFVGVSMQQMTCTLCRTITCLKCKAVHEFKTCEDYEKECRSSNGAQAAPETDYHSAGAAQALPNGRSSSGAESQSTQLPPAAIAARKAAMEREASRLQESLVGQAPNDTPSRSNVPANQTQPVFGAPRAMDAAASAQPEALMIECCACMAEAPLEELVEVAPCCHFLCKECVRTSGVSSLTYVVHCPVKPEGGVRCQSQIQESALRSVMNKQEYNRHKGLLSLPVVRCPVEGCDGKFSVRPGMGSLECASCQTEYCVDCSANHPGLTCTQFIDSVPDVGALRIQDTEVLQSETASSAAPTSSSEDGQDCNACFADIPIEEIANIEGCGHMVCRNCICGAKAGNSTERVRCPVVQDDGSPCQYYIQEAALESVVTNEDNVGPNVENRLPA